MLAACVLLLASAAAAGAAQGPWWHLESRAAPSNLASGAEGRLIVSASNVGTTEADGSSHVITVKDTLPPRFHATAISGGGSYPEEEPPMSCSLEHLSCTYTGTVLPFKRLEVTIHVQVQAGPSAEEQNTVSVEGGGAPTPPALTRPVAVSSAATPFGVEDYALSPEEEGGTPDLQAGSHPFQLTATFDLNQTLALGRFGEGPFPQAPALTRNLTFKLPPGLVGNPNVVARCSEVDFATIGEDGFTNLCPADTAVGAAVVSIYEPVLLKFSTITVPLFNLIPAQGEPARFGFEVFKVPVVLDTAVHAGEGYAVSVSVTNASQAAAILGSQVTFWGQPGSEAHDHARGWACLDLPFEPERGALKDCTPPARHSTAAFLTLPTSCSGAPLLSEAEGVSWPTATAPAGEPLRGEASLGPLSGCGQLPFNPSITTQPDQSAGSTPSGLTVDVHVPQASTVEGGGLAESAVKTTTVVLPEGMTLNPAAAGGLAACTAGGVGLLPGVEERLQAENDVFSENPWSCPEEAKVGTVQIKTPLLDHELRGAAYLSSENTNPYASPLVLYLLVHDPVSGVQVKLAGTVSVDPTTGRISSTFQNTPQLPFEELKLHFFDGPHASLTTPAGCGVYESQAVFTPWSGAASVSSTASFEISQGAEGASCPAPAPFAPVFNAQSRNPQAGAFTPFTLNLKLPDQDQRLASMSVHLPPGVAAMLSSVTPCHEPQASQGACGPDSLIGHTSTNSGFGPEPLTLSGSVYLTGPYNGAPFGLAITTPAIAGPFNLGTVVVRAAIRVDPSTAAVTIDSVVPTMVETSSSGRTGIPVELKELNVTVDRPGFEFNPTNCTPTTISATLTGAQGAADAAQSPFQIGGCENLPFHPLLTGSVGAHASKANGTSFVVRVTSGGLGQANIQKVDLQLPAKLPSRLTTLQKACPEATFNTNPATCSDESIIGTAIIHTPVFANPLTGPAYLVSHGNAQFPDVEFVLQGEGVTILLDGKTDIKKGVTYSRFDSAPDAPFTSFETVLPAGPHSALTAHANEKDPYNLCTSKLQMPTDITAQNGAVIKQVTPLKLTGCSKAKLTRAQLLAKALQSCRKKHKGKRRRHRRFICEHSARTKYGAKPGHRQRKASARAGRLPGINANRAIT